MQGDAGTGGPCRAAALPGMVAPRFGLRGPCGAAGPPRHSPRQPLPGEPRAVAVEVGVLDTDVVGEVNSALLRCERRRRVPSVAVAEPPRMACDVSVV